MAVTGVRGRQVTDQSITFVDIQQITQARLLGRYTVSTGVIQEISIGSNLTLNTTTGVLSASGTVTSVTSADITRITIGGTSTDPTVNISASYVGQTTITTLGTIATGTWNSTVISGQYGGTGIANTGKTITLGGNLTTAGAFASTFTMTNTTTVTFPTTGTLATLSDLAGYIQNTTSQQASSNFNISGNGTIAGYLAMKDMVVTNNTSGITWYETSPLDYGIYRTAGTWSANDYQQLRINFATGIQLAAGAGVNTGYGKSYVDIVSGFGLKVSSGGIGIGVAPNTTYLLDVNGTGRFTGLGTFSNKIIVNSTSSAQDNITWSDGVNNTGYLGIRAGAGGIVWMNADNNLVFATAAQERVRISQTGAVTMGVTLSVTGDVSASNYRATGAVTANATGGLLSYQGASKTLLGAWGANSSTYGNLSFYLSSSDGSMGNEYANLSSTLFNVIVPITANSGFLNSGVYARFQGSGIGSITGAAGVGINLFQSGGSSYVESYNSTSNAYSPVVYRASSHTFNGGNLFVLNLATGLTAPTTTGTTKMVITDANGLLSFTTISAGTVSSVSVVSTPSWLTGSVATNTTTPAITLTATTGLTANQFLATPNGSTGAVGLRSIVAADIPTLNQNTTGSSFSTVFQDTRNVNDQPQDIASQKATYTFKDITSVGSPSVQAGSNFAYIGNYSGWFSGGTGGGGYNSQVSYGDGLAIRQATGLTTWGAWRTMWHDGNFIAGTNYENPLTFNSGLSRSGNTITLNQAFAPTWTGLNTFNAKVLVSGSGGFGTANSAQFDLYNTTANTFWSQQVNNAGLWQFATNGGATALSVTPSGLNFQFDFYNYASSVNFKGTGAVNIGNTSSLATSTPNVLSLGGTHSPTAGANLKLKIYDDGGSILGFGVSAGQLDYGVSGGMNHGFYVGSAKYFNVNNTGAQVTGDLSVTSSNVTVSTFIGAAANMTVAFNSSTAGNSGISFQKSGTIKWYTLNEAATDSFKILNGSGVEKFSITQSGLVTLSSNLQYSNVGVSTIGQYDAMKTQGVWSMGSAYVLPSTGGVAGNMGNLYGLGWSYNPDYGGAGNNPQSKAGLSHQLLVMVNGVTQTAIGAGIWTTGNATVLGSINGYVLNNSNTFYFPVGSYINSSPAEFIFLTPSNGAAGVKVGSLLVSNSYGPTAPTNGIYSLGDIKTDSNLYVSTLTSGRVPFITTSGQITDSNNFRWDSSQSVLALGSGAVSTWGAQTSVIESDKASIFFGTSTDININSNAYFDGSVWRYKSTTTASNIVLYAGTMQVRVAASGTAGTTLTWSTPLIVNSSGLIVANDIFLGNSTSAATATPRTIDMGGTYSNAAGVGAQLKLKLWNSGGSIMGIGPSNSQLDYIVPTTSYSHSFYVSSTKRLIVDVNGIKVTGTTQSTEGIRSYGSTMLRVEGGNATPVNSIGIGLELFAAGGKGWIEAYNRTTSAYIDIVYTALSHSFVSDVAMNASLSVVSSVSCNTLTATETVTARNLIGNSSVPTIAGEVEAGTTPTVTVVGNDTAGLITVTTDTTVPNNNGGVFVTITFNVAYTTAPYIVISPGSNWGGVEKRAEFWVEPTDVTTGLFKIYVNNQLTASSTYKIYYHVIG